VIWRGCEEELYAVLFYLVENTGANGGRQTRSIVFICHSLGGLVVKEALIKSAAYNSHRRHPTLAEIYASTIGVIFLGTPHRGSDQETLGEVAANVAKLSFRQPNKQLLQTLKRESHILESQRDQFTTISSNLSIVCIREELPTGVGLV
jgi:protein SERAC1